MDCCSWDLLGWAIKDYYYGDTGAVVLVHNNLGGTEKLPAGVFFRGCEVLPEPERYALSLCQGNVLDVGAGAGCHSLILQERGFPVHAIDLSLDAAEIMRDRGVKNVSSVNIRDFQAEPFDTVLMLMNGIGLVGDYEGLEFFLKDIKRLLKPDGQILTDTSDLYSDLEFDGGLVPRIDENYGQVSFTLEYKGLKGTSYQWLFVHPETLEKCASKLGWYSQIVYQEEGHYLMRLVLSDGSV